MWLLSQPTIRGRRGCLGTTARSWGHGCGSRARVEVVRELGRDGGTKKFVGMGPLTIHLGKCVYVEPVCVLSVNQMFCLVAWARQVGKRWGGGCWGTRLAVLRSRAGAVYWTQIPHRHSAPFVAFLLPRPRLRRSHSPAWPCAARIQQHPTRSTHLAAPMHDEPTNGLTLSGGCHMRVQSLYSETHTQLSPSSYSCLQLPCDAALSHCSASQLVWAISLWAVGGWPAVCWRPAGEHRPGPAPVTAAQFFQGQGSSRNLTAEAPKPTHFCVSVRGGPSRIVG